MAVDGSHVQIPINIHDRATHFNSTKDGRGYNLLHLNALYDLESQLYLAFLPSSSLPEKRPFCAGTCRILPYGSGRFYLYHLEITESFRSRGFGRALLFGVLNSLPSRSRVILQVSSENTAALSLYKKTGFGITKTLSYYRRDIPDVQ